MTNKEAITLLRNLEDSLDSYCELNEEGKTAFRMAIEALSGSESPNGSDTIYRQDAINALAEEVRYIDGYYVEYDAVISETDAMDAIKALPSAQLPDIHVGDMISRQQAVELIERMKPYHQDADDIAEMIDNMPSTQPKTGNWTDKSIFYGEEGQIDMWQTCKCSKCGRFDTRPYMYYFSEPNYCSYCGAKRQKGVANEYVIG